MRDSKRMQKYCSFNFETRLLSSGYIYMICDNYSMPSKPDLPEIEPKTTF